MSCPTRRSFLSSTLAAGAFAALPRAQDRKDPAGKEPAKPLRILVLGGTGFLGPSIVRAALPKGHQLTLFNRGRSRKHLFPEVERILGDQDPAKGEGLKNLEKAVADGRTWDAVIDDIAYYPALLKPRLELLAKATAHYVLISSISAYAKNDQPDADETSAVAVLDDENRREMGKNYEHYGALKAACERAAEKTFPGRCANVRPGFIVGPEDPTDRFTYWPVRYDRGGEMLWPGTPDDPVQIIDVRDLGAWLVKVVETRTCGVFNACGPGAQPWTMGGLLAACKAASKAETKPVWVPAEFLKRHGQEGDAGIPIWIEPKGASLGFHRYSNAKARAAGLVLRAPEVTTKDTLAWFQTLPAQKTDESRDNKLRQGLTPEVEQKLLAAYRQADK